MTKSDFHVTIARDLEPLIPTFMANRAKEVVALKEALAKSDFAQLHRIGHRMKGLGGSYGFERITRLGQKIEECAKGRDAAGAGEQIDEYARYLEAVKIEFV